MLYIVTLDEMKAILGIKDIEEDAQVTALLEGLQGRFDSECNRSFLYATGISESFDGGAMWLLPKRFPIDAVTSISVNDDPLDAANYIVNKARGRLAYATGSIAWPKGFQNITVVYSGGMINADGSTAPNADDGDVEALRRALRMQASFEWRNRMILGQQSVSAQGINVTLAKAALLPDVKAILDGFWRF